MGKTIHIQPLTRIEGHAEVKIHLDDAGNVARTVTHFSSMRGFEKFVQGRPAEEIPRIVTRICGICPWHHHLAATRAVEACFSVRPPKAGRLLRECMQNMAHISDKILHFYFMAAPDFLISPDDGRHSRSIIGIMEKAPDLARQVIRMRQKAQMMMERFAGKVIHPVAALPGGFSKPLSESQRQILEADTKALLAFSNTALDHAQKTIFPALISEMAHHDTTITTGFMGTVDSDGTLNFYEGKIRLMKPDGSITDFDAADYLDHIGEAVCETTLDKRPYAGSWDEGYSTDLENPKGIYRSNCLARLNVCDGISTPLAGKALGDFRTRFGPRPQHPLLYHWARLIELIYACEKTLALLRHPDITRPETRCDAFPGRGRGVGHVEAPRGTLIHDYTTDDDGCMVAANMIVGTTHNLSAIAMGVEKTARELIHDGHVDETILNKVEMAVRAYDP